MNTILPPSLQPKPGFDWNHVSWGKPESLRSALCSYCSAGIGEDVVPLILSKEDGHVAQFCDACMEKWWGMRGFDCSDDFDPPIEADPPVERFPDGEFD